MQKIGRSVRTRHFVLLLAAREAPGPARLGVVATKKTGGAVVRNRIKRLCRECFRNWPDLLPRGVDLVVIAHPGAQKLVLADVQAEWQAVEILLKKRAAEALARAGYSHHPGSAGA